MNRKEIENCDWMRRIANQVEDLLVSNPQSRKQFIKHLKDYSLIFKQERERNLEELLPYDDPTGKNYEDPTGGEEDGPKLNSGAKKNYPIKAGYDVKKPEISSYYAALSVLYDCIKGKVAPVLLCRDVLDDTTFSLLLLRLGTDGYDKDDLNSALKWVKKDLDSEFRLIGTGDATPKKQDSDREKARELLKAIESFVTECDYLEPHAPNFTPGDDDCLDRQIQEWKQQHSSAFPDSAIWDCWKILQRSIEKARPVLYDRLPDVNQTEKQITDAVVLAGEIVSDFNQFPKICEPLPEPKHPLLTRYMQFAALAGFRSQREKKAALLKKYIDVWELRKLAGKEQTQADTKDEKPETPPPAVEKAYQSFCWAEGQSGKTKDKEVYAYLIDNPFEGYDLPAFETWQSNVSRGRAFYKTHKNTPRAGRPVRAPKAIDDPNLLRQISHKFEQS